MTPWAWYWKHEDDDSFGDECPTREDVIAYALRDLSPGDRYEIVEARMSEAAKYEATDFIPFLRTRNREVLTAATDGVDE